MALFKPFKGRRTDLDNIPKVDGHAYFCIDDGTFWIDYKDAGIVKRKQINKDDWTVDIKEAINELPSVARSGLIEDLSMLWDTELIFDGGDADVQIAILDETILL